MNPSSHSSVRRRLESSVTIMVANSHKKFGESIQFVAGERLVGRLGKEVAERVPAGGPGALFEEADFDQATGVAGVGLVEEEVAEGREAEAIRGGLPGGRRAVRVTTDDQRGTRLFRPSGEQAFARARRVGVFLAAVEEGEQGRAGRGLAPGGERFFC